MSFKYHRSVNQQFKFVGNLAYGGKWINLLVFRNFTLKTRSFVNEFFPFLHILRVPERIVCYLKSVDNLLESLSEALISFPRLAVKPSAR